MRPVRILITGGTIDDLEYSSTDAAPKNAQSKIPQMLEQSRVTAPVEVEVVMMKDSKFITDDDREALLKKCETSDEEGLLITHGSMTMCETASYLAKKLRGKTIVLTGALVLPSEQNSDALFNLGYAIHAAQTSPVGVYVAMNGKIFDWKNVRKNMETGFFECT